MQGEPMSNPIHHCGLPPKHTGRARFDIQVAFNRKKWHGSQRVLVEVASLRGGEKGGS